MNVEKHVYITVNGREVEYQAISLDALRLSWAGIEKEYRERGDPIDPPTYEITTAGGSKITEKHDETTLQTDEDRAAWAAYSDALRRLNSDKTEMQVRYIYEDGILAQVPGDASWQNKYRARKIEIPTEPDELREFYLTTELLVTHHDVAGIVARVMTLSQQGKIDEAALETALDSFRDYIRKSPSKRPEHTEGEVET